MNKEKLQFFDYNGYNLNFDWNREQGYWEGTIYLPKVSVGLYANTTIYVLEEVNGASLDNENNQFEVTESVDNNRFDNNFVFPYGRGVITFEWDRLNKFVDEFFMFNFDETYILKDSSSLTYTPNDGPDCEELIVNRFDKYTVNLEDKYISKPLPIHVAFMANEKYDATTYNRTLMMSYGGETIAKIKFYAETVEEDERLKIWNDNLGYNITPEDEMIFYKSDIKEYRPDYQLLNEKRKELMLEGSNIYPYIGSYKAIINAIKFFGYENLNIIEYWRNVNKNDENFGKVYHSSKYSLTNKETLRIGTRNIVLPNKDYKKINSLSLVYTINQPTGEVDEWELPKVKEKFTYTIEEALIKLFALRKKLNKEFMPGSSKIIDIIGEASYFGIKSITRLVHPDSEYNKFITIKETSKDFIPDFDVYPGKYIHITDNTYFGGYINRKKSDDDTDNQIISDIYDMNLSEISNEYDSQNLILKELKKMSNKEKCKWYREYYNAAFVDYTEYKSIEDNDEYPYDNEEYQYNKIPLERFSAKCILKNTTFDDVTFENCELTFNDNKEDLNNITFENIDVYGLPDSISWTIKMSENQYDDDLKNIGVVKEYPYKDFSIVKTNEDADEFGQIFVELPYVGYYDVTMEIGYDNGSDSEMDYVIETKTKKKCIKVEPYNIDLIGFYYDARNLPDELQYDMSDDMKYFIDKNISSMHGFATAERTEDNINMDINATMPYFNDDTAINPGPYETENINSEWYLVDNLSYEISELTPLVKYTRYIRSGVDVKPYTWFLLGYEYSKIAGKVNPHWYITNNTLKTTQEFSDKKYLTLLLKKEGNYTVTLELEDKLGNTYNISRNIIVVSNSANYGMYQTFKKEYDYYIEQKEIRQLNDFYSDDKEDIES